jgi:hypothetical protein
MKILTSKVASNKALAMLGEPHGTHWLRWHQQVQSPRMTREGKLHCWFPSFAHAHVGFILYQGHKCLMGTPDRANSLRKSRTLLSNYWCCCRLLGHVFFPTGFFSSCNSFLMFLLSTFSVPNYKSFQESWRV